LGDVEGGVEGAAALLELLAPVLYGRLSTTCIHWRRMILYRLDS
jgi:hypothetical protein